MSSQNRVDPFQIRPESGLGGRWPIIWRPGTSVEGGTRFWPSGFRVYPILAIALFFLSIRGRAYAISLNRCDLCIHENRRRGNQYFCPGDLAISGVLFFSWRFALRRDSRNNAVSGMRLQQFGSLEEVFARLDVFLLAIC